MTHSAAASSPALERSPVLDDRALFGHPRGLGLLFVTEMWERFSYYGMRALLVLYLVNALRWETARAASLYGTYTMLVYLTPLLGGVLADRFLGTRHGLVLGGAVIAAGHFALALPGMTAFYAGLALIVAGTGLFKPNASTMVGQLYRAGDARRDAGFTIFYMGVNAGAFLGPLVCGALAQSERLGWHWGFAAAGVGMVLGLAVYVWGRDRWLPGIGLRPEGGAQAEAHPAPLLIQTPPRAPAPPSKPGVSTMAAAEPGSGRSSGMEPGTALRPHRGQGRVAAEVAGGVLAGVALALLTGGASVLGIAFGATVGGALAFTLFGSHGEERKRVIALFLVAFFVVFFWAAYEQAGSSMNLFADRHTDLRLGSLEVPSSWFQSVNPAIILLFAPLFAMLWSALGRRGLEPATPVKMVLGLALLGVGFLFLVVGGGRADGGARVSPLWLLGAYLFHTLGELCLSPVGLSYVSKIAPARFGALLMGAWYLANAAANKIAGALAAFTPTPGAAREAAASGLEGLLQRLSATHAGFYGFFVVTSFAAAAVMLLFVPLLRRLTASVKA